VLFLRAPMVATVAALPSLLAARISLDKLETLELAPETAEIAAVESLGEWQSLQLAGVEYRYPGEGDEAGFDVGPIDLELRRGELVFLVGGNGSGKSTLARLLTGLHRPAAGEIRLDGRVLQPHEWQAYRQLFASVYTDFHLFARLLGPAGTEVEESLVRQMAGAPAPASQGQLRRRPVGRHALLPGPAQAPGADAGDAGRARHPDPRRMGRGPGPVVPSPVLPRAAAAAEGRRQDHPGHHP